ncbi:hypothetical protein Bca4012_099823 [Brassica carinata]
MDTLKEIGRNIFFLSSSLHMSFRRQERSKYCKSVRVSIQPTSSPSHYQPQRSRSSYGR